MEIKRVGVLSLAKILGVLYGAIGLIAGAVITLFSVLGSVVGQSASSESLAVGLGIGIGSVIILPIMYGLMGLFGGCITALLYNLTARFVGGLQLEVESQESLITRFD